MPDDKKKSEAGSDSDDSDGNDNDAGHGKPPPGDTANTNNTTTTLATNSTAIPVILNDEKKNKKKNKKGTKKMIPAEDIIPEMPKPNDPLPESTPKPVDPITPDPVYHSPTATGKPPKPAYKYSGGAIPAPKPVPEPIASTPGGSLYKNQEKIDPKGGRNEKPMIASTPGGALYEHHHQTKKDGTSSINANNNEQLTNKVEEYKELAKVERP